MNDNDELTSQNLDGVGYLTRVGLLGLALVSFLATAALVRQVTTWPQSQISMKLDDFEQAGDRYDLFFIGNSTVYRGVVPEVFDRRMAERGIRLTSFNLAAQDMRGFETEYALRRAIQSAGPRLKTIVVLVENFDATFPRRVLFTRRMVDWHTVPLTIDAVRVALRSGWRESGPRRNAARHAVHGLQRLTSYGMGPDAVLDRLPESRRERERYLRYVDRGAGHIPLERDVESRQWRRDDFLRDPGKYHRLIARNGNRYGKGQPPRFKNRDLTRRQAERLVEAGFEVIYLTLPSTAKSAGYGRLVRQGVLPSLLQFDDPRRYPEYFTAESRFDTWHLTEEAARQFSVVLADAFADRLEETR